MNQLPSLTTKAKTWWGAIWRGVVVDAQAKHYRKMRLAFWLFVYLVIHADRKTGELRRKYQTVASEMGLSERTVRRFFKRLEAHGYISLTKTGRAQLIRICKWRQFLSGANRS